MTLVRTADSSMSRSATPTLVSVAAAGSLLCALLSSSSLAQSINAVTTPVPATPNDAEAPNRLQQGESTYQLNLRKIHGPLLQEYARRLDLLQQQLLAQSRAEHANQVSQEAQRIRQILATTGVLPLTTPRPTPAAGDPVLPDAGERNRAALSLRAADAVSPAAVSSEARKALPLGSIAWNVNRLAVGNYDVLLVFSAPPFADEEPILLTIGSQQLIGRLPPDRATGDDHTFRVFKLGNLNITAPVEDKVLTLQSANPLVPRLRISNVLFVRTARN